MDIVERLSKVTRPGAPIMDGMGYSRLAEPDPLSQEAATEITRLREENKVLRQAIGVISQRMEALEDESFEGLSAEATEHSAGFWRGQKSAAKSLRLHLHDMVRTALATTGGE